MKKKEDIYNLVVVIVFLVHNSHRRCADYFACVPLFQLSEESDGATCFALLLFLSVGVIGCFASVVIVVGIVMNQI